MKRVIFFICFLITSIVAQGQQPNNLWGEANELYSQAKYEDALKSYGELEKQGYVAGELYYNIANTYYKLGHIGKAILYYERALKIDPSDNDAQQNLEMCRQMKIDRIEVIPEFILNTWTRSINYSLSSDYWAALSLFFIAFSGVMFLIFRFARRSRVRKISFILSLILLVPFIFSLSFAWIQNFDYKTRDSAVVMSAVSAVRSSPDESGKDLFILHEGTKVKMIDSVSSWKRISLSDGREGWISARDVEII